LKIVIIAIISSLIISSLASKETVSVFSEGVSLPVIMYHSVLESEKNDSDYIVSTKQLEEDIQYLKQKGYTPVTCKDLIKYTTSVSQLPENPVLLTFDDGMYNNVTLALPILEKHNFPAVFSIVGSYADEYTENNIKNTNYSYIPWEDIQKICLNPCVELANHSYNLHSIGHRYGSKRKKKENFSEYLEMFLTDTKKMQQEFFTNCTFHPVIYTYPFGEFCSDSERILKKNGFLVTFSCIEGMNKITRNPDCLYLLKRFNRSGKLSTAEFFAKSGL